MKIMDHSLARGASWLLIYLTAVQPMHPAIAAGITAANGNTNVTMKPGNVPVVNIATPNKAGVSHNTYKDFNVNAPGTVLNNATSTIQSQLAGQIAANSQLKGKAAELIINEVTGSSRSELKGKLEVAGAKANVMIANPNGISCDGCGFVNAPGVVLTTGKPTLDKQGALDRLDVTKGSVIVGEQGLDGNSANYVDVISRATELNGKIKAKTLNLTQGANRVSYQDGTVKTIAGVGAKPLLAVDTKALGGMYAGKIRLVATESGVGINLNNVTSTQRDISLTTAGKITLSNVKAQTDLNISANSLTTTAGASVRAERDMTLAATSIDNHSNTTASGDIRVFANTVRNSNGAALHSGKNMWIQKDAQGNKSTLVENRSARIQTNSGDLIIRAEKLNNVRDTQVYNWANITPDSTAFVKLPRHRTIDSLTIPSREAPIINVSYWDAVLGGKWFGVADFNRSDLVNIARKEYRKTSNSSASSILAGASSYLNVTTLVNNESQIRANHDLIMTGKTLNNISGITGVQNIWNVYDTSYRPADKVKDIPRYTIVSGGKTSTYSLPKTGEIISWKNITFTPATLKAGGNLVADFSERIDSSSPYNTDAKYIDVTAHPETITAKNILLHAGTINTADVMNATEDIVLQSEQSTRVTTTSLTAGNDISIFTGGNLDVMQSDLQGRNITLVSRSGNVKLQSSEAVNYFNADGSRALGSLAATGDLLVTAGGDILLRDLRQPVKSKNISLVANGNLTLDKNDAMLNHERPGFIPSTEQAQQFFNQMLPGDPLWASGDITLSSGKNLNAKGVNIDAGGSISLTAGGVANLGMRILDERFSPLFLIQRTPELRSTLKAGKNILINAASDVDLSVSSITAGGSATLQAGKNLLLGAFAYDVIDSNNDNNHDVRNVVTSLRGTKALTLAANGLIQANGSSLTSNGDITLTSSGNMRFEAAEGFIHREQGKTWSETVSQTGVTINSGGALTVLAGGSILFQATRLLAKQALDVAANGGWLYAQAMEESSHYEKKTTTRKWWGKKTTIKKTKHTTTNRVTEFTADGNINLLSRDDSTYEASKISAGKNARLTSTHGKINFRAVKNTSFEQTVSTSKGFYIKQVNKGYNAGTWVLPSVYAGSKLTIDAAKGISADVKAQNSKALQGAISAMGALPGMAWLKNLNTRSDVQWNTVKDAYDSWSYKSQSLNPVVAAVIAIAAASVTAGTGLAAMAGNAAITATGVTGSTATAAVYGSAYAGMTSLVSQAAVALVENKGNVSRTLTSLGSSSSVKSLVTAMTIGGALAGLDDVMTVVASPEKARLPVLVKDGDWGKVVQRVAGQSVISSSLNTAINGGNLKDNLVNALLSNIGSQIQAEGAGLIGDNGEVLGVTGKAVSHAVLAGISAEIGQGDGKGAAAGALAAELAGVIMQSSLFEPANLNEKERQYLLLQEALSGSEGKEQTARFIGGLTGALVTHTPEGTNSGADSAQLVYRYNMTEHMLQQYALDNQRDILAAANGDKAAAKRVEARREAAAIVAVAGGGGTVLTVGGITLVGAAPELLLAARLVISGCPVNPMLCVTQAGIFAADILAPEAVIGTGSLAAGSTLVVGKNLDSVKTLVRQAVISADNMLKGKEFNFSNVVAIVDKEKIAGGGLSRKTADYLNKNGGVSVSDFFKDTKYTDKVKRQSSAGDYHSFPESVDAFSGHGTVSEITGGDGVKRWKLEIPGNYRGEDGIFEYIKNPDGSINHRLFIPENRVIK